MANHRAVWNEVTSMMAVLVKKTDAFKRTCRFLGEDNLFCLVKLDRWAVLSCAVGVFLVEMSTVAAGEIRLAMSRS